MEQGHALTLTEATSYAIPISEIEDEFLLEVNSKLQLMSFPGRPRGSVGSYFLYTLV